MDGMWLQSLENKYTVVNAGQRNYMLLIVNPDSQRFE